MLVTRASSAFTGQSRGGGCIGVDLRQIFSHCVEPRSDKAVVLQTLWCFLPFCWLVVTVKADAGEENYKCHYIAEGSSLGRANGTRG